MPGGALCQRYLKKKKDKKHSIGMSKQKSKIIKDIGQKQQK